MWAKGKYQASNEATTTTGFSFGQGEAALYGESRHPNGSKRNYGHSDRAGAGGGWFGGFSSQHGNGGGGGGYFGGITLSIDLNQYNCAGGAGGSSYASGCNGCRSIKENSDETNEESVHYSHIAFRSIEMKSGIESIISPEGTNEVGHNGSGAIAITLIKLLPHLSCADKISNSAFYVSSIIYIILF